MSWNGFHGVAAVLIAVAVPAGVWLVNGVLPVPVLVLGAVLGMSYWYWRPFPGI
ncbi:hypothetical protein [Aureimonas sp. AU22]|uniref:hypothetical protein n=1 Tax=Aureimonas sp. AU22 TaxID=1638162 RepID=UPI000A564898|nr:hypothetical protein [Aureimonas sp. AU22]